MFMDAFNTYDYDRVEQYLQGGFNPNFYQYFQTILLTGSEINATIDPRDSANESTPIELAINRMDFTLITLLLKYGADINLKREGRFSTPLRYVLISYVLINAHQIIDNDPEMDDFDRNRARLMVKYIEQVIYLITKYGNPDLTSRDGTYGRSILKCAWMNKYSPRINQLILEYKTRERFPGVALASFMGTIGGRHKKNMHNHAKTCKRNKIN